MTPGPAGDDRRRRHVAMAGHLGDDVAAAGALDDPDPAVRATALGALHRLGSLSDGHVRAALADADPGVRRRAARLAATLTEVDLTPALADPEPSVVEEAAWAAGERSGAATALVPVLGALATGHGDALVREAAVAALGAIGDPAGLAAVLTATTDKPAVRRRAVIALAAFEGPDVDAALERARRDRDWQVRQVAEDLLEA